MYYKKNRSILRSIRNNKNNKTYYTLVVVMLAAICLIAASIILRGYDTSDERNNTDTVSGETTSESMDEQESTDAVAAYRMYIFVEDGVAAYCSTNLSGDIIDIVGAARCSIGNDVKGYLGDKNHVVLSGILASTSKAVWTKFSYNEAEYYVQYYSMINGIEFHSALYEENGRYNSIVVQSYEAINEYPANGDESNTTADTYRDCPGITLSVASAKAIYENVPAATDVYIYKSFSVSDLYKKELLSGRSYDDINTAAAYTFDAGYIIDNRLPDIPDGYSCDPTDTEANYVFSPYRLGAINNVSDKTIEAGQAAYSLIDPDNGSSLIRIIFNDVSLTDENGSDISSYLMSMVDLTEYADVQIAGMNINAFLLPGDYVVRFYAADVYGNSLNSRCYLHVVDTTPPVITLGSEITEINQAQLDDPDYIRSMVTVTDLCKLSDDGVSYELSEDNGVVHITFSASDVYGNTGKLEAVLQKVD